MLRENFDNFFLTKIISVILLDSEIMVDVCVSINMYYDDNSHCVLRRLFVGLHSDDGISWVNINIL